MIYNSKIVIEGYCSTGKLSEEEVDFLESKSIKNMITISKIISISIAH